MKLIFSNLFPYDPDPPICDPNPQVYNYTFQRKLIRYLTSTEIPLVDYEIPSHEGKTVVITGASSGLGLEMAKQFVGVGAHVVIGCRDKFKCINAVATVEKYAKLGGRPEFLILELDSSESIAYFAKAVKKRTGGKFDVLCLNADVYMPEILETSDHLQTMMGMCYSDCFLSEFCLN